MAVHTEDKLNRGRVTASSAAGERLTPGEGNGRGRNRVVDIDHVIIGGSCVMVVTDDAHRSWGKHEWWSEG